MLIDPESVEVMTDTFALLGATLRRDRTQAHRVVGDILAKEEAAAVLLQIASFATSWLSDSSTLRRSDATTELDQTAGVFCQIFGRPA